MKTKSFLTGLFLILCTAVASATPWIQKKDFNETISSGGSYEWSHDLREIGFAPGSDLITSFSLAVTIKDDASDPNGFFGTGKWEWAFLNLPGLLADAIWTSPIGTHSTGTSLLGSFNLNQNGTLSVTLSSTLGDFVLTESTLTATGIDAPQAPTNVPEPDALALMGLGLAGLALARRRNKG